jgi:hypothetical protein
MKTMIDVDCVRMREAEQKSSAPTKKSPFCDQLHSALLCCLTLTQSAQCSNINKSEMFAV